MLENVLKIAGGVAAVPAALVTGTTVHALVDDARGDNSGTDTTPQEEQGVPSGGPLLSHLPAPIKMAGIELEMLGSLVAHKIDGWEHKVPDPGPDAAPVDQARASWAALKHGFNVSGDPTLYVSIHGKPMVVDSVWPRGQQLDAALDLAGMSGDYRDVNSLVGGLSMFRVKEAYAASPWTVGFSRFYDDNAWIALDLLQAYRQTGDRSYLDRVQGMMPFFKQGLEPNGGELWEENNKTPTENTCSTAPVEQVMLETYEATHDPQYLQMAQQLDGYLKSNLRAPNGMYYDHRDVGTDKLDDHFYSYNQGAPIGADVELYRITGNTSYLDDAKQTAAASLDYYSQDDRLWKESPAFNAIFFRNLLALDQVAPDPRYRQAMNDYLDRAWKQGRNPATGLFDQGGIGSGEGVGKIGEIDQASFVEMYALRAGADPGR
jgi:hypothetical protein